MAVATQALKMSAKRYMALKARLIDTTAPTNRKRMKAKIRQLGARLRKCGVDTGKLVSS